MTTETATNDNVIALRLGSLTNRFGVCPVCRRQNGVTSVGFRKFAFCNVHRVRWHLFIEDVPEDQVEPKMSQKVAGCREVDPFDLLRNGTADEIAAYHAGVAEVKRIAADAGFTVRIGGDRDIIDPLDAADAVPGKTR